ncbi:MAG: AAA family ATPase [Candidatus Kapaibacteriota bacterium]|jgi:AAA15 family ATPase/GTPase
MIVDFTIKNFRSIKDELTLSLVATENHTENEDKITHLSMFNFNLLKSSVIYGANASGKSNIILALLYLKQFILNSTDIKLGQQIPFYEPFCLDTECIFEPTVFEIEIVIAENRYIYCLKYELSRVVFESLVKFNNEKEYLVFERNKQEIKFGKILKGKKSHLVAELLENQLFITKGANSNLDILKDVYLFFVINVKVDVQTETNNLLLKNFLIQTSNYHYDNEQLLENKIQIERFLKSADTGISEIKFYKKYVNDNSTIDSVIYEPILIHDKYEGDKLIGGVEFKLNQESKGTIKMFELALMVLNVINKGHILIIDELDASFHPLLTEYILSLFNDSIHNPNSAQLIFTTHETSILTFQNFREDQIWFTEKDKFGASTLFSLAEFEKNDIRQSKSLQNWYLSGRFGGLPMIDKLEMYEIH